jgi:large subunit ribosomal protein L10
MNKDQKTAVVDEIAGQLEAAEAVFAVDYRGLSVSQAAELRGKLRDAGTKFRIVKNSLTERAAEKAGAEDLKPLLEGPTALALVQGDAALAAKALNDTARALGILEFKGGLMNGATIAAEDIRAIARLPGREVLHGQLVGTVAAPLSGLVRGLNALVAGLAIQLKAIADQGLVSGTEAPEPPIDEAAESAESEEPASAEPEEEQPPIDEAAESPESEEPASAEPEAETETETEKQEESE